MRWLKAAVLLRAFVLWALLIGQAVVIGVALIRIDLIDHPYGAEVIAAILVLSGVVGLMAEAIWRRYRGR